MKGILAILAFSLSSGLITPVEAKLSNAELKIGITQEFENLNPIVGQMYATNFIQAAVYRSSVMMDAQGKWLPLLVKKIPTIENKLASFRTKNGVKSITSTWEIHDNAMWGDGTPLTCADLKFGWEVGSNPNVSVPSREPYDMIESIEWNPKQERKCTINFKTARWDFFMNTPPPIPRHIEGPVYEQYKNQKEGYDQNSNYNKNASLPGLYNGPYRVSELSLGSHVVLVPNEKFYGKKPAIQKLVIKLIPNTGTLEANLRSGNIDMISTLGLSFDEALSLDKKAREEKLPYNVHFQTGTTYEHIDLNLDNEILKDIRVRRALVHAINRNDLTNSLFEGKQTAAIHDRSPMDPLFTKDPKKIILYESSKREARRLLDEAGWKQGADGIRVKDGKRLSLQLMTTAGNKTRELVQTMLQSQWKEVGVEITIKNEPARVFFGDTMKQRKFGGLAMFAWVSTPGVASRAIQHSKEIPTKENNWSGSNYSGWKNMAVDDLYGKMETEFNAQKRTSIAQEIMRNYTNDVPVIPLFYRSDNAVLPKNLKGVTLSGHAFMETYNVENWRIE